MLTAKTDTGAAKISMQFKESESGVQRGHQKSQAPYFVTKQIPTIRLINPNTILQGINRRKKYRTIHSLCKKLIVV
jgi:hypothetical protein